MMYDVVDQFEKEIAKYAGSKYACVVNSCTNALLLACDYLKVKEVTIPSKTYVSVPQVIIRAGGEVKFKDLDWQKDGVYQLYPYPVWDSARWITSGLYKRITESFYPTNLYGNHNFVCISLHWGKTFNLGQGGVILHDDTNAQAWFKKARFDGRTQGKLPKDDQVIMGWHCYMSPRDAADALTRLHFLPKYNNPLPIEYGYADLSKLEIFKERK